MEKFLTITTLRDYILEYFPETLWWDGFNKHEVWNGQRSFKHRAGLPNEIRIEFDSDDRENNWENINLTAVKLNNIGISFAVFYVEGGRSPHLHIYDLDELEQLTIDQRTQYRIQFLKKICPIGSTPDLALCEEKHLCALEFANHFKYNKPKELLSVFWNGKNMGIDHCIKVNVTEDKPKKVKKIVEKKITLTDIIRNNVRGKIIENLTFETVFDKYKINYKGHMAICPFHPDSNRSISFSNEKGLWKCFGDGCGKQGDIITMVKLLKERENGNKN